MRVSVRISEALCAVAVVVLSATATLAGTPQKAPERVVSANLCTDQLALLLAAPGQLVSVSRLSRDPQSSLMVEAARALPVNDTRAESIFLFAPDLVLTGTYADPATVQMLRSLGIRVEQFKPADSLAEVRDNISRMGDLLGREEAAAGMLARFDAGMAAASGAPERRPRAALYYANGYTTGGKTLAGDILRKAGFANVADEAGIPDGGNLPLERLVMLAPDVILRGHEYPGYSRANEVLKHPALRALPDSLLAGHMDDRHWICGTPAVIEALQDMRALRQRIEAGQ
ncbi:iron complex transport system substrate-binding protein [Pontibaca methylaminivorans]|uniref:Iron complex transport system substrate-binding protein n=1 Tax=Pontibaca methylaminivorans TaxID=515897 RepID=A0A1R3WX39_9RHOB|nr:iron complex transport system substrate-binding protein [Pontibaca methylaminivorans]